MLAAQQRKRERRAKGCSPRSLSIVCRKRIQQRLTAVHLFFDFLIEEGQRTDHPVGRGKYTPYLCGACQAGRERALVPRFQTLPWIPSDEQWRASLAVVKQASLRTRCMAALAYNEHQR